MDDPTNNMKFFSANAAAALLVVLQLLHTQPGTAAATVSSPAAAPAGPHRRTQWWATAMGGGGLGDGGQPNPRPTPRPPTRPPPTLPTGGDYLQFVEREPDFRLGRCEGDCDKDSVRSCVHKLNYGLEAPLGTRFSLDFVLIIRLLSSIYFCAHTNCTYTHRNAKRTSYASSQKIGKTLRGDASERLMGR